MKDEADKLSERLSAYLDGQLSAEQAAALEQELARDTALAGELAALRNTRELLRGLPRQAAPPEMLESILQRVERERLLSQPAHRGARPLHWMRYAAAAAAIVLGVAVGVVIYQTLQPGWVGKNHLEVAVSSNPDKALSLPREASGRRSGVRESAPAGGGSVDLHGDTDLDVGSLAMRPEARERGVEEALGRGGEPEASGILSPAGPTTEDRPLAAAAPAGRPSMMLPAVPPPSEPLAAAASPAGESGGADTSVAVTAPRSDGSMGIVSKGGAIDTSGGDAVAAAPASAPAGEPADALAVVNIDLYTPDPVGTNREVVAVLNDNSFRPVTYGKSGAYGPAAMDNKYRFNTSNQIIAEGDEEQVQQVVARVNEIARRQNGRVVQTVASTQLQAGEQVVSVERSEHFYSDPRQQPTPAPAASQPRGPLGEPNAVAGLPRDSQVGQGKGQAAGGAGGTDGQVLGRLPAALSDDLAVHAVDGLPASAPATSQPAGQDSESPTRYERLMAMFRHDDGRQAGAKDDQDRPRPLPAVAAAPATAPSESWGGTATRGGGSSSQVANAPKSSGQGDIAGQEVTGGYGGGYGANGSYAGQAQSAPASQQDRAPIIRGIINGTLTQAEGVELRLGTQVAHQSQPVGSPNIAAAQNQAATAPQTQPVAQLRLPQGQETSQGQRAFQAQEKPSPMSQMVQSQRGRAQQQSQLANTARRRQVIITINSSDGGSLDFSRLGLDARAAQSAPATAAPASAPAGGQ